MKKFKRLANSNDLNINCYGPFSNEIVKQRDKEYYEKSDVEFKKDYRNFLYTPSLLEIENESHYIQLNFCNNTFCKWYGLSQLIYDNLKFRPLRYTLQQTEHTDRPN
ncbi:MAG TPA: hypothetical protein VIK72_17565 [Clostridiaceae bacterium]